MKTEEYQAAPPRMQTDPVREAAFRAWATMSGKPAYLPDAQAIADAVEAVRQEERKRASALLAAATEHPMLSHYQQLAAKPTSEVVGSVRMTWGLATWKLVAMAGGLGAGITAMHWCGSLIERMMWSK